MMLHTRWVLSALLVSLSLALCGCGASAGASAGEGTAAGGSTEQQGGSLAQETGDGEASQDGAQRSSEEYAELPLRAYLDVYSNGEDLHYSYGAPKTVSGMNYNALYSWLEDEELLFEYGYAEATTDDPSAVFGDLGSEVASRSGGDFSNAKQATGLTVDSQEAVEVGGWPMCKVTGSFSCDGTDVPFVGYAVIDGPTALWCVVADDTSDQSTPTSTLAEWADKVAATFRIEQE